jgi:hypothetical protein
LTDAPLWLDEVDLATADAHVRMGTHALVEDQWLLRDHFAQTEIALCRRLLAEQREHVFACTAHAEAAAQEVDELVDHWLVSHRCRPDPEPTETHPLARAGARVQEDLCLMVHHHGAWHLEGAVLCFPSLWVLAEKIGRPTTLVHHPVPYYKEELSARVDSFFERLAPGKVVWRRNLSLWPALLLWAPCHTLDPAEWGTTWTAGEDPPLWLRSERQTLRRLPGTGAILFSIRVQTVPITVLTQRIDRARDLAAWLRAPIGETRRHQMGRRAEHLLAWLDQIAGQQ